MGSECIALPARLRHAGDVALVGGVAQADPTEAELAVVGTRSPTAPAAVVFATLELCFAALSDLLGSLGHLVSSSPRPGCRRPRCLRPRRRRPRPRFRA